MVRILPTQSIIVLGRCQGYSIICHLGQPIAMNSFLRFLLARLLPQSVLIRHRQVHLLRLKFIFKRCDFLIYFLVIFARAFLTVFGILLVVGPVVRRNAMLTSFLTE